MSFEIQFAWLDGSGIRSESEAATWAEIGITLGEARVSELLDERLNSKRSTFFGAALPLAEWIVDCWPRLINERRGPALSAGAHPPEPSEGIATDLEREWWGFHSLRAARRGGAIPNLLFRRLDPGVFHVQAFSDSVALPPGISVRFLRDEAAKVPAEDVLRQFHGLVEGVLARLQGDESDRVATLRARWRQVVQPTAELAGRFGVDDESLEASDGELLRALLSDPRRDEITSLAEGLSQPLLADRLRVSRELLRELPERPEATPRWHEVTAAATRTSHGRPWLTGWSAAADFRELLRVSETEAPGRELPRWLEERCGWTREQQIFDLKKVPDGVDTIYVNERGFAPAILTSRQSDPLRRFRLAGALYHFLFARSEGRVSPRSPLLAEYAEANAFAAELLAPAARLRSFTPAGGWWDTRSVGEAARALEVSPRVIRHQIENRRLGRVATDRL